jgi:hypothetical protein
LASRARSLTIVRESPSWRNGVNAAWKDELLTRAPRPWTAGAGAGDGAGAGAGDAGRRGAAEVGVAERRELRRAAGVSALAAGAGALMPRTRAGKKEWFWYRGGKVGSQDSSYRILVSSPVKSGTEIITGSRCWSVNQAEKRIWSQRRTRANWQGPRYSANRASRPIQRETKVSQALVRGCTSPSKVCRSTRKLLKQ